MKSYKKSFKIILCLFKLNQAMQVSKLISMKILKFGILVFGFLISSSLIVHANGLVSAKITDGWIEKDQKLIFGLKIDLNKNWKTYWRLPGNAGLEPLFTFDKSENVLAAKIMWPSPIIFGEENLSSIGYKDSVLLPLEVTPIDTSKPIKLEIQANIGLCEDVCIPVTLNVSYFATPGQNQENYEILGAILSEPIKSDDIGFQPPQCIIKNGELIMEFNEKNVKTGIENIELFVIEVGSSVFYVNSKKAYFFDDRITVSTKNSVETELPGVISRETIKTTIIGSNQSLEFIGCSG